MVGFGWDASHVPGLKNASDELRRELVQSEVRQQEAEKSKTKAVSLQSKKLTWNELWSTEPLRLKFAISSVNDT